MLVWDSFVKILLPFVRNLECFVQFSRGFVQLDIFWKSEDCPRKNAKMILFTFFGQTQKRIISTVTLRKVITRKSRFLIHFYYIYIGNRGSAFSVEPFYSDKKDVILLDKVKSGNLDLEFLNNTQLILENVRLLGLNTVNVPFQVDVPNTTSNTMTLNEERYLLSKGIVETLQQNRIKVILEPFPYIRGGAVGETA